MAFIDSTYFFGDLAIAQKTSDADNLQWYIDEYEPELLKKLLGYELYRDFQAGLQETSIPQKWLDLLYGTEYTLQGKLNKWVGFIEETDSVNPGTYFPGDIEIIVDSALVGLSTWSHPTGFLTGKSFRVIERGVGPLGSDVTLNSNGFTLTGSGVFELNDRYYIEFTEPVPLPAPAASVEGSAKLSLIANYVFYFYSQSNRTASTGTGEKQVSAMNATNASAQDKEIKAWNKMANKTMALYDFLTVKATDYPQWNLDTQCSEVYKYKNSLGL